MKRAHIIQRGGGGRLFGLRLYLVELQRDYFHLLRNSTAALNSLHARGGPSTHPEVLRYAQATCVLASRPVEPPNGQGTTARFVSYFHSKAQSELGHSPAPPYGHNLLRQLPQITPAHDAALYAHPDPQEVLHALTAMKPAAAPELDGFAVQFYKAFWELLGPVLCAVIRRFLVKA